MNKVLHYVYYGTDITCIKCRIIFVHVLLQSHACAHSCHKVRTALLFIKRVGRRRWCALFARADCNVSSVLARVRITVRTLLVPAEVAVSATQVGSAHTLTVYMYVHVCALKYNKGNRRDNTMFVSRIALVIFFTYSCICQCVHK